MSGTPAANRGLISLSADPYTNQAGADPRLNANNPGGGQLGRLGIGVSGQVDNVDVGAVRHAEPAGGGGVIGARIHSGF